MGTIVAIHVAAFEYNLYSSGDDTMVQIAVQFAISRVGTIEIGNGEGKAGGIEEFKVTVSRCFATVGPSVVGPKVSPAFLSIFLSMDLPSAIGCR